MVTSSNKVPKVHLPRLYSIPSGFVLGRVAAGVGPVQLLPLINGSLSLGQHLQNNGSIPPVPTRYLGFYLNGPLALNQKYYGAVSPTGLSFSASTGTGIATALQAPIVNYTIYLYNAAGLLVATISWTAKQTAGSVTWHMGGSIAAGTAPYIQGPAAYDGAISGISLLFPAMQQ